MGKVTKIINVRYRNAPSAAPRWLELSIEGSKIDLVSETAPPLGLPQGASCSVSDGCLDGQGAYLCPGLINLHTHLFRKLRPGESFGVGAGYDRVAFTVRALRNARDYLRLGVTTVRDVGAPEDLDISLARLIRNGLDCAPTVVATGRPLTQTGGHNHDFGVVVDGPDALRRAVRERVLLGADWIKLMASQGGTRYFKGRDTVMPPEESELAFDFIDEMISRADPEKSYAPTERDGYTFEELYAAAEEASRQGVSAAAHAVTAQSIINCVKAGISTIEHGTYMSVEAARLLAKSKSVYIPTVSTAFYRIAYGRRDGWGEHLLRWATYVAEPWFASVILAKKCGVRIAIGTDAGGDMHMEMHLLERAGFSRHEVLQAATEVAADVLQRPDLGRLQSGSVADVLLLSNDPLDNLDTLKEPLLTIRGGSIYPPT